MYDYEKQLEDWRKVTEQYESGLERDLRDEFAKLALPLIFAYGSSKHNVTSKVIAISAYQLADEMMEARNAKTPTE